LLPGFRTVLIQLGQLRPYLKTIKPEIGNRKLSIVNDPEGKSRVIAILDYYSQLALKCLNNEIFKKLKSNFSQDRTFTQDPVIKAPQGNQYHSLDLSSATDRFPIELQSQILSEMISYEYSYF